MLQKTPQKNYSIKEHSVEQTVMELEIIIIDVCNKII